MRYGVRVNGKVLYFVVDYFCLFSDHDGVFLLNRHVVHDVLNLIVVSTHSGHGHPNTFLHVVSVPFLVGHVLHSPLRSRRVRIPFKVVLHLPILRGVPLSL